MNKRSKLWIKLKLYDAVTKTLIDADREATLEEILEAKLIYEGTGICYCQIYYDEDGFMYVLRNCGICGKGLDAI